MLQIKNISKKYITGDLVQHALNDVSLSFRDNEFVAILGHSGSGKTTMLNIVGGLDRYDEGDLIINGISTKKYKDRDWDAYRNHAIGFVFQSYNLIPHQSVLANVELALTISGISKAERRKRAKEALTKVGLGDQLHKRPNQMSGGQMQRVAIARALVNNPAILLADEPTGALDTDTSVQVMELLREVAKDRLVVMVTHNPDLAKEYATRVVNLKDGKIVSDSKPFEPREVEQKLEEKKLGKAKMSFGTALGLSLNNLMTKKARTILTSVAGSIGIIGIALILSLSTGVREYIDNLQKDTLSTYPLQITRESVDMSAMIESIQESRANRDKNNKEKEEGKVYSSDRLSRMLSLTSQATKINDMRTFKEYLDSNTKIEEFTLDVKYGYNMQLQIFSSNTDNGILRTNPSDIINGMRSGNMMGSSSGISTSSAHTSEKPNSTGISLMGGGVFQEMIDNRELLDKQYDVVAGRFPDKNAADEIVLVVSDNDTIVDLYLYAAGLLDPKVYYDMIDRLMKGETIEAPERSEFTYEELLNTDFKLIMNTDYFKYNEKTKTWDDMTADNAYMKNIVDNAMDLKIVGILRQNKDAKAASITAPIAYTHALSEYMIEKINNSEIIKQQLADPATDVFTGLPFNTGEIVITMDDIYAQMAMMTEEEQAHMQAALENMSEEQIIAMFEERRDSLGSGYDMPTYAKNIEKLGYVELDDPSAIYIYPKDFKAKDSIENIIKDYNKIHQDENGDGGITYTDYIGLMMKSVTTMIKMITYILIAFVAISLVVSSIMIGIITYISVLERTKEIGILRSIGASKKNISSIFNAETLIIGFVSGAFGIAATLLLLIPANFIIEKLSEVHNLAVLPVTGAAMLIAISMILSLIAGIIPSKQAANKDPVTALRTE